MKGNVAFSIVVCFTLVSLCVGCAMQTAMADVRKVAGRRSAPSLTETLPILRPKFGGNSI